MATGSSREVTRTVTETEYELKQLSREERDYLLELVTDFGDGPHAAAIRNALFQASAELETSPLRRGDKVRLLKDVGYSVRTEILTVYDGQPDGDSELETSGDFIPADGEGTVWERV